MPCSKSFATIWNKGFQAAPCLSGTFYRAALGSILRTNAQDVFSVYMETPLPTQREPW